MRLKALFRFIRNPKTRWKIVPVFLVIIIIATYFIFFHKSKLTVNANKIIVAKARNGIFNDGIQIDGKVEPIRTVFIDADVAGKISDIFVEEGDSVKKGQTLFVLSNSELNMSIMNSESALAEQSSRIRESRLALEQQNISIKNQLIELKYQIIKQQRLHDNNVLFVEKGLISKEEFLNTKEKLAEMKEKFDLLKTQYQKDSLNLSSQITQLDESLWLMHNNLKLVRQKLDKLVIKSPINGIFGLLNAEIGETKKEGARLGAVYVLSNYKVKVSINERYIDKIRLGMQAKISRNKTVYLLSVSKIYPELNDGHFAVDLKFVNSPPHFIKIGQVFRVSIEFGQPERALILSRGDYPIDSNSTSLFVISKNQQYAQRREVEIGRTNIDYIEIIEGIEENELVITTGYKKYDDVDILQFKNLNQAVSE